MARISLFETITTTIVSLALDVCMSWQMRLIRHQYSSWSTSSTTANAPDIVTSTVDVRDSRTENEAAVCDTLCDEDIDHSSKEICDGGPVFRPFLLGTGYC